MREIRLALLDKSRPVVILTRDVARASMTKVTVAPITSTVKGLSSEVLVGVANGLQRECAVAIDNVMTIPIDKLGKPVGYLLPSQEHDLGRAMVLAYDLDVPLSCR